MEFPMLNIVMEKWDINRITSSQLKLEKTIASGGQGKVKIGKYYSMFVIVKILHKISTNNFITEMLNAYKYRHPNIPWHSKCCRYSWYQRIWGSSRR